MSEEWYSNKELFEKIQDLAGEMKETRELIRRYNSLYKTVKEHDCYIKEQQGKGKGRKSVEEAFIKWGGWLAAVVSIVYTALKLAGLI